MRALGLIGAGLLVGAATAPPPTITDLVAISLHPGVNRVPGFLVDGGTATIVEAWRDNGNAHGYYVWMVLAREPKGGKAPVVEFEGRAREADVISASPFDGERVTADVRFATARIDGNPVSLAIEGSLDEAPSGIIADHARATITWYRLVHRVDAVGEAPDAFVPIGSVRTIRRYCNVDLAMRDVAAVSLPRDFGGPNRVDGCFADAR